MTEVLASNVAVTDAAPMDSVADTEIEATKESTDWFVVVRSKNGERMICNKRQYPLALPRNIVDGTFAGADSVKIFAKANDKWATTSLTLVEFAKSNFALRVLYEPVWAHAIAGLKWGALAGVGLKLLDTAFTLAAVDARLAVMFLAAIGVCFISRIGPMAVLALSFAMARFTPMNMFVAALSAALAGTILGCLPGMGIGGVVGLCRKNMARAKDAVVEPTSAVIEATVLPLLGAGAVWAVYLFVLMPWLMARLAMP